MVEMDGNISYRTSSPIQCKENDRKGSACRFPANWYMNGKWICNIHHILRFETFECSICMETCSRRSDCYVTQCQHGFHKRCIEIWKETRMNQTVPCPLCRAVVRFPRFASNGSTHPISRRASIPFRPPLRDFGIERSPVATSITITNENQQLPYRPLEILLSCLYATIWLYLILNQTHSDSIPERSEGQLVS